MTDGFLRIWNEAGRWAALVLLLAWVAVEAMKTLRAKWGQD